ncbi:MAG TPA: Uma2 family endonuclease [Chloroflexota bacterium]|nr:Uma2 family endonuclease [Chloroflexota bacterium]
MATRARATVDDVLRLAGEGERYELVDGELIEMSPTGFGHGYLEWHIASVLGSHVQKYDLGKVVVGEVLFQLDRGGRLARAADVAFVRKERLPTEQAEEKPFLGPPDLAVEIVSPSDSAEAIQRKVDDWLEHGTVIVLVAYPAQRRLALHRRGGATLLEGDDDVDLDPALPGFRCKARDLFPASLILPAG